MATLEQRVDVNNSAPFYEVSVFDSSSGEGGGGETALFKVSALNFVANPIDIDSVVRTFATSLVALNPAYSLESIRKIVAVETSL